MVNMKLLALVAPLPIYNGCYTRKKFWEKKFTGEEKLTLGEFSSLNINHFGRHNVR